MAETAALLVEHRLPAFPWRQWVLSFPRPMAVRLGYDRALLGSVCERFAARVMQTLRRLTKRAHVRTAWRAAPPCTRASSSWCSASATTWACSSIRMRWSPTAASTPRTRMNLDSGLSETSPMSTSDARCSACTPTSLRSSPTMMTMATTRSPRETAPAFPLLVTAFGMQLHAAVTVDGRDRCH